MSLQICGPSKIPAFSFSRLNPGKYLHKYLKQPSFLSKALTNCFIKPSLIWRGGNIIFSLSTSGSLMMFSSPTFRAFLVGQHFFIQCCCFALLSHKHIKHGYLVYPVCCPSKKFTILRSTQIDHWCSS